MSATEAPTVTLNVTDSAVTEIKKFMAGEEDLPQSAGLRVRVVPGGCSEITAPAARTLRWSPRCAAG